MRSYFNNTTSTALSEILNNRAYCFKINKELSTSTFISISTTAKETISYKKVTISVDNLRGLFSELISSTNTLLEEELLFNISNTRYKDITLETYSKFEDRSITTPFICFRDLVPNSTANSSFLKEEIFSNAALFAKFFISKDSSIELNIKTISIYLKAALQFKKYCLLLVYLVTGLPLRGTELVTLRYLNSIKDIREMFLDISSNLFIINISYYKGQSLSEKKAQNIRYLPPLVSRIVLLYIVLVDPFIQFLNISLLSIKELNKTKSLVLYFFFVNNNLLDSRDLSYSLSSFSNKVLGQKLNIQVYRQIIISIIKEFMLEKLDSSTLLLEEDLDPNKELVALQSNHSSSVENLDYARNARITFSNINSNLQFKYLQFCLRYFAFFKIDSFSLSIDSYRNQLAIQDRATKSNLLNIVNSSAVRYSKTIASSLESNSKKHSRQVSSISSSVTPFAKRVKTKDLVNLSSLHFSSSILTFILQDFLGDSTASFRSFEQELLVKSILLKVPYILGVLPTSAGKSLSYLLTSSLSTSKVTIVITPLVGLKSDIARRAKEFNIPYSLYEDNREFKNLTLVSIESIISDSFLQNVRDLIDSNKIDRIVLEECYLLFTASSYRSIMYRFKEILRLPLQFIFLSGTLPLDLEEKLIKVLLLKEISIIRASCLRVNISYNAIAYTSNKKQDNVLQIRDYIEEFKVNSFVSAKDKILIFCPSIKSIDLVSNTLNCSKYYASLSTEVKEETLNKFFTSNESYYKVLVASSALEEGLDYSSIRLVIYKDIAYSFIGFLQGSSRAGRDCLESTSTFFYNAKDRRLDSSSLESSSSLDLAIDDKAIVYSYLKEQVCRKRQISLYLDNNIYDTCTLESSLCDLCCSRKGIIDNQVDRIVNLSKEVEKQYIYVKNTLETAFTNCVYCLLIKEANLSIKVNTEPHLISSCTLYSSFNNLIPSIKAELKDNRVSLSKDSCCFTCLLPTTLCSYYKKTNSTLCFSPDFIFSILSLLYIKRVSLHTFIKLDIPKNANLITYLKICLKKVYIKELDTEGLRVFQYLFFN